MHLYALLHMAKEVAELRCEKCKQLHDVRGAAWRLRRRGAQLQWLLHLHGRAPWRLQPRRQCVQLYRCSCCRIALIQVRHEDSAGMFETRSPLHYLVFT